MFEESLDRLREANNQYQVLNAKHARRNAELKSLRAQARLDSPSNFSHDDEDTLPPLPRRRFSLDGPPRQQDNAEPNPPHNRVVVQRQPQPLPPPWVTTGDLRRLHDNGEPNSSPPRQVRRRILPMAPTISDIEEQFEVSPIKSTGYNNSNSRPSVESRPEIDSDVQFELNRIKALVSLRSQARPNSPPNFSEDEGAAPPQPVHRAPDDNMFAELHLQLRELNCQIQDFSVTEYLAQLSAKLEMFFGKLKRATAGSVSSIDHHRIKVVEKAIQLVQLLSGQERNLSHFKRREVARLCEYLARIFRDEDTRILQDEEKRLLLKRERKREYKTTLQKMEESLSSWRSTLGLGKALPSEPSRVESPPICFDAPEPAQLTELGLEFQNACRQGEVFRKLIEKLVKLQSSTLFLTAKIERNIQKNCRVALYSSEVESKTDSAPPLVIPLEKLQKDRIFRIFINQITSLPITKNPAVFIKAKKAYLCEYDGHLFFKEGGITPLGTVGALINKRQKLYKNSHISGDELPNLKDAPLLIGAITELFGLAILGEQKIIVDLFLVLKEMAMENKKSADVSGNEKLIRLAEKLTRKVEKTELVCNQLIQDMSQLVRVVPRVSFDNGIPPELGNDPIFSLFICDTTKRPICFEPYFNGTNIREARGVQNFNLPPLPAVKALIEAQKRSYNGQERPSTALLEAAFAELQRVFPAFPNLDKLQQLIVQQKNSVAVVLSFQKGIPQELEEDMIFSLFVCPITGVPISEFALDPTQIKGKTLYERRALKAWADKHYTSPTTRAPLESSQIIRLPKLTKLISERIRSYMAKKFTQAEIVMMLNTPPDLTLLQEALSELQQHGIEDPGLQAIIEKK